MNKCPASSVAFANSEYNGIRMEAFCVCFYFFYIATRISRIPVSRYSACNVRTPLTKSCELNFNMSFSWSSSEQSAWHMGTFRCHCTREWTVCILCETMEQPSVIIHLSAAGRYNSVLFVLLHWVMENSFCIANGYNNSRITIIGVGWN